MKRKFTLLLSASAFVLSMNSQVMLNENFTSPFTPTASGWAVQNNSVPQGTLSWFQGAGATFTAYNGAANDYYAVNYDSQGPTSGGISNFLITPTVNLTNGGVLNFATRTVNSATVFPDRLQVLISYGTGTGAIGAGTTAVGTFTSMILDINPNLTTNTVGTVNNGTVNGYPNTWTVYSLTLATIPATLAGRIAFRYFVDNGGPNGTNSDYIGIDAVNYTFPCVQPTIVVNPASANVCSGVTTTLTATGGTSYTWAPGGQTTASIAATPLATTIYTVTGVSAAGCPATKTVAINVTASPTVAVNNATTCAGTAVVLQASGAASYSWQPGGQTTSSISAPGNAATYTVIGTNGACNMTKTVSVVISSSLGLVVTASPTTICSGNSSTLTVSGANSYSWNTGSTSSSIVVTPGTSTNYTVGGLTGACTGVSTIAVNVNQSPTVTGAVNPTIVCLGANPSFTLTGTGAVNYSWTIGGQTFTSNPLGITTPTATGVFPFVLTGQSINGCLSATLSVPVTVTNCNVGIQNNTLNFSEVSVYPNPFTNELKVTGFSGNVEFFNLIGQMVVKVSVTETESINTASLSKGVYIVKAINAEGIMVKTLRVIKN
jgi:hypothetical protein